MSAVKRTAERITAVMLAFFITGLCINRCPTISYSEESYDLNAMAEEIVLLVNEARTEAGLEPLYMVPYLCDVSNVRARECIVSFSHTRPDGELFITALDEGLVPYTRAAENIAAGSGTAEATFDQWRNSEGHWAAIMNPNYTHIGVGVCYERNSEYGWYWEQLFVTTDIVLENQTIPERNKIVPESSGDINGDGSVNSFDLVVINKYLSGNTELNSLQLESADMLSDGIIDENDSLALRKYILGQLDTLPVTEDVIAEICS